MSENNGRSGIVIVIGLIVVGLVVVALMIYLPGRVPMSDGTDRGGQGSTAGQTATEGAEGSAGGPGGQGVPAFTTPTVPKPDLTRLAPAVQQAIRSAEDRLNALLDRREVSGAGQAAPLTSGRVPAAPAAGVTESGAPDTSVDESDVAAAFGELGKLYLAAKLLAPAEPCLSQAEALAPGDHRWPHYLGLLHESNHQRERAIEAYERAIGLDPGDLGATLRIAGLYLAGNRPDLAEPLYSRVLDADPRSAAALYGLGTIALGKGDDRTAVDRFEAALAASPGATSIYYPLAQAYRGLGMVSEAEARLKKHGPGPVPPQDPLLTELAGLLPDPQQHLDRALQLEKAGRLKEATEEYRRAAALFPDNPVIRWNLGAALAREGDRKGAREQFEQTLKLQPNSANTLIGLGMLDQEEGSTDKAIALFRRAVEVNPVSRDARFRLADALQRKGKYEEALAGYEKAISLDPAHPPSRLGEAMMLIRLERWADAKRSLQESMQALPDRPEFAHFLAQLLATCPDGSLRDGRAALDIVERLQKNGNNAALAQTRAMALAELGRFDEAAAVQRAVLDAARRGGRPEVVASIEKNLALYESGRPCRDFWTTGGS